MKIFANNLEIVYNGKSVKLSEVLEYYSVTSSDDPLSDLRRKREKECFSIVDRGKLWYDELSASQYAELMNWRQAWLDVTKTKIIPATPKWINEHLEGEEIL